MPHSATQPAATSRLVSVLTYLIWALLAVLLAYWAMRLFGGWLGKAMGSPSVLPAGQVVTVAAVAAQPLPAPLAPTAIKGREDGDSDRMLASYRLEGVLYNTRNPSKSLALVRFLPTDEPSAAGLKSYAVGAKVGEAVLLSLRPKQATLQLPGQPPFSIQLAQKTR